jgi:hypothetical protein
MFSHPDSDSPSWSSGQNATGKRREERAPRRTLPSSRANPDQQIKILIALAELDTGEVAVERAALARHLGKGAETVGDCLSFLGDLGLAEVGRGRYSVTERGRAFAETWPRDTAQARLLLRPPVQAHWSAAAAAHHLAGGPMPQEKLAEKLRTGLPGVPMRGLYMVEWLIIALIIERDDRLRVSLPTAQADAGAAPPRQETAGPEDSAETTMFLGLSATEIQALPDGHYVAFLEGVLQTLRSALAPAT